MGKSHIRLISPLVWVLLCAAVLCYPLSVSAQLSPGDLNEVHADLEGLKNCEKCHETGKGISAAKCLNCHVLLKERVEAGLGLHSNDGFDDCVTCHVEHLGRNSQLIWWENEIWNFDHSLTGYSLEGKHKEIECRKCHNRKNIKDAKITGSDFKNQDRTYLGLSRNCVGCHTDEHRGQLSSDCRKCHDFSDWKKQPGFNHDRSDFPLTGKHLSVACDKCHILITTDPRPDDPDYLNFSKMESERCISCHEDYHKGKFDQRCESCHVTSGWRNVNRSNFDHHKTGFPLLGKHAAVACDKCHTEGRKLAGIKYGLCSDCHSDYHQGQLTRRKSGGECDECHTVNGFSPAKFGIDDHRVTDYPLEGSHLAVACPACHSRAELSAGIETIRFRFDSTRCVACHNDPHKEGIDKYRAQGGCEYCHSTEAWNVSQFNHGETKFPLSGRHLQVACRNCHKPTDGDTLSFKFQFGGLDSTCMDCHIDIHLGQFADTIAGTDQAGKIVQCNRCHVTDGWKIARFDHNSQSSFKLEGAHIKTSCSGCHAKVDKGDKSYILYKPLDSSCISCHKAEELKEEMKGP